MTRVVMVVGAGRNVGKTLLGEWIVRHAAAAGLKTWVVKHVHHSVDYRVKDTGRYLEAGASRVYALAPGEYMLVERVTLDPLTVVQEARRSGVELVIVEGFRAHREILEPDYIVCIGLREEWCDLRLEPQSFNPCREAARILQTLGYRVILECKG